MYVLNKFGGRKLATNGPVV